MPAIEITAQEIAHHMAMLSRTYEVRRRLRNLPAPVQREAAKPAPRIQIFALPVLPVEPVPLIHASACHVYKTPLRFPVFVPADAPEGYNPNKPKLLPRDIIESAARKHGISADQIVGPSRLAYMMIARFEVYYRLREEAHLSFPAIGRALGGRDHTSALSGWRKFKRLLATGEVSL